MKYVIKINSITCPVSVSNLYNRKAGLFAPLCDRRGVIDGDKNIHETGLPKKKKLKYCYFLL